MGQAALCTRPCSSAKVGSLADLSELHVRAVTAGCGADALPPVVVASPALEHLAKQLRLMLSSEDYDVVDWETFKSGDPNTRFKFSCVAGRRVVFLFDSVDQNRLFEQLSFLQALQGFAVPDAKDADSKWKTYAETGHYSWGRAAQITVVMPWYRPCQMERTSRWELKGEHWCNSEAEGPWIDVPTAQTLARLLATPAPPPPGRGPSLALDGMPLKPLWCPPLELLFVELHEERPVQVATEGLSCQVRAERFVPYFLEKLKNESHYTGADGTFVIFPDQGACERYGAAVVQHLGLARDHILWIKKTRVGSSVEQVQKLFYNGEKHDAEPGEKTSFQSTDHMCIIDDFTNTGSTLLGALGLARSLVRSGGAADMDVSIFVSHFVANYDAKVVRAFQQKLHNCGPNCRLYTTNTIPLTTDHLIGDPQVEVLSIAEFLAQCLQ